MWNRALEKFGIGIALVVLCVVMAVQSPAFLTPLNLFNIMLQVSINTIIAVGMTFVILTGGIDLSVGSTVALVAVIMGTMLHTEAGVLLSVLAGVAAGALCGLVNGVVVSKGRVPAFIATLGMMSAARGLALIVTQGQTIHMFPAALRVFGTGYVGPIPVPTIVALATVLIAHYVLTETRFGRYVFAVGGNREAVRLSGVSVSSVEITVYVISGITCALGAIVLVGRLNSAQPIAGYGYELSAIAAVAIGGSSMSGGEGGVLGTLIGALIMGVLQNGLTLMNVSSYVQQVVIGLVIVAAVLFDQMQRLQVKRPQRISRT
jgi:ribose/xylose/arabinose/galactoside ABC-type transport system permease subunit